MLFINQFINNVCMHCVFFFWSNVTHLQHSICLEQTTKSSPCSFTMPLHIIIQSYMSIIFLKFDFKNGSKWTIRCLRCPLGKRWPLENLHPKQIHTPYQKECLRQTIDRNVVIVLMPCDTRYVLYISKCILIVPATDALGFHVKIRIKV